MRWALIVAAIGLIVLLVLLGQVLGDHATNIANGVSNPFDQSAVRLFPILALAVFSLLALALLWQGLRR